MDFIDIYTEHSTLKQQDPSICCLQKTPLEPKDTSRLKVKGWRSIFHANGPQNKAGIVILILNKLDFKVKTVVRDKEGHYIILKGSIHQEDLTIVNIYAPNMGAANISQLLIKIKSHIDTLIVGDLNMPLSVIDRSSKQKINKETRALNDTLDQMDLIDCLLYTSPSPRDVEESRMPSSA